MGLRVTCKHCGGSHPAFYCKKSTGVVSAKSAVPKKAVGSSLPVDTNSSASLRKDCAGIGLASPAKVLGAEAANIKDAHTPKRGRGRPRTITDMKVYKAMKQREYRARKKNG